MYYYAKSGLNCLLIKGKVVPLHADYYQRSLNGAPWCVWIGYRLASGPVRESHRKEQVIN
jgi:hypothetical protein